jgi:predicted LPLAT superfamily acyltransferase
VSLAWQHSREGGGHFAIWLIRGVGLHVGRGFARLALYPITLYFFLRRREEVRCSRDFYTRLQGQRGSTRQVLHQIHHFACTILDRVFLLSRGLDRFAFDTHGVELLEAQLAKGRGVLLLGSHYGSFEALRALSLHRAPVKLRVVLDKQQTPSLTKLLEELAPEVGRDAIDISAGTTQAMLAIADAARQGHMIALLADRPRAGEATRTAPFLGDPAPFPLGPWQVAAVLDVPVVLSFGTYLGGNRYRLDFEPFAERVSLPRQGREAALDALLAQYARRLEHYVREYPDNWFNFYDFWQPPLQSALARGSDATQAPSC